MKDFLLGLKDKNIQEELNIIKKEINDFAKKFPLYN